jgi:hypothetical protein
LEQNKEGIGTLEDVLGDLVKDEEDFGRRKSKVEVWIKVKLRKK